MSHRKNAARRIPGRARLRAGHAGFRAGERQRPAPLGSQSRLDAAVEAALIGWGQFVFRYRNLLFPVVLVSLFAVFRPQYPYGSHRLDQWLDGLGVALALAGQGVRAAASGYARVMRSGKDRQVHAERLVTDGLYCHSRNPLYAGNLLILMGLFTIHNNPWVYAIGIPFFLLAYNAIVRAEESYLQARFGTAYEEYCRRVNRWLPGPADLRRSVWGPRFSWRRVVRQEHGSAYAWMVTALLLLGYDTRTGVSAELRPASLHSLALPLLAATGCWAAIRGLKRAGRLNDEIE